MDKLILADVMAAYEQKQQQNHLEEQRRAEDIRINCPQVQQLVDTRHRMVMQSVHTGFTATGEDPVALMEAYNEKIRRALAENGYPADYLAPVHQCALCEDKGYVYEENVKKHCPCVLKAYEDAVREADKGGANVSFSSFDPLRFPETLLPGTDVSQREYMQLIREKCLAFTRQLQGGPMKTVLLHGGSGLGKTYLLRCMEREAAARGVSTLFITAYDLLDALRQRYFGRDSDAADSCLQVDFLLVDDLGMEPLMENITVEQIYHLLSHRLSRGLYTAFSTNLARTELQKRYTERVTSRLLDVRSGLALPFQGEDIRLKK